MITSVSLIKKLTGVKCTHIDNVRYGVEVRSCSGKEQTFEVLKVDARPWKSEQGRCPICQKKCPGYDTKRDKPSVWRAPNLGGMRVYFLYQPHRIECPEHKVQTEYIPWQDGDTRSMEALNDEVTFLALGAPKTMVAEYIGMNWRTIGNCIKACHDRLEPDLKDRFKNLKRICVDETSYKKGHKYITVVNDMDSGRVVWIHEKHGEEIFKLFCEEMPEEDRKNIELVAGDGAKWIDTCREKYFPDAKRCVDPFHVVGWINEALDEVRKSIAAEARQQVAKERKELEEEAEMARVAWLAEYDRYMAAVDELSKMPRKKGRKSDHVKELEALVSSFEEKYGETMDLLRQQKKGELNEEQKARLKELEKTASVIKGCKYALGMNPENLSACNQDRLELIKVSSPDLYEAYRLKETLRVIIHMKNRDEAASSLDSWIEEAKASKFAAFVELGKKIERHKANILNSIETGGNSSLSEQTNGIIKGIIKVAHGFRNLDNMFALIYLRCSDIVIPLANRYRPSAEELEKRREKDRARRRARQERKKKASELSA